MANNKQIKKEVRQAYENKGQASAFDVANKHGVEYEMCKPCETESPHINHECLICGSQTESIKALEKAKAL